MKKTSLPMFAAFTAVSLAGIPTLGQAAAITISGEYQFLDNRGINSINLTDGLRQQFGANVVPNGGAGTLGAACQNGGGGLYACPGGVPQPMIALNWGESGNVAPDHFSSSVGAAQPNNSWTLGFQNGSDIALTTTPDIFGALVMGHPDSVAISGSGLNPTFTWSLPTGGPTIDAVRLQIWDKNEDPSGSTQLTATLKYLQSFDPNTTSFTVTGDLVSQNGTPFMLNPDHAYSLEISLLDLRDPTKQFNGEMDGRNYNILSRSRSFFDFTVLDQDLANVYLPQSSGGPAPLFSFQPIEVIAGQQIFIDPLLAIGYDYAIGESSDPKFASVLLPAGIGDGLYDIYIWDGTQYVLFLANVQGGQAVDFDADGEDRFRVLGIELAAGLDPADPTAFITGLTFTEDGVFRGTMQAITASVPEPSTLALMGLAAAAMIRRKRPVF